MLFNHRLIFIFIVLLTLSACKGSKAESDSAASNHAVSQSQEFCGSSEKRLFGFNDAHHTQFLIPESFLFDPYNAYHKVKDPAEFISIRVDRESFSPVCSKEINDLGEDIIITIKPLALNSFSKLKDVSQAAYPKYLGKEGHEFDLYTNEFSNNRPWERRDFLLPTDQKLTNTIFIGCSYTLPSNPPYERVGCGVTAQISDTIYAMYVIHKTDLSSYKELNEKLKELLLGFLLKSEDRSLKGVLKP